MVSTPPFPVVRLVATDLDGTLLGPDRQVSARTASTLRAVAAAGVEVVAVTGRSHRSAVPLLAHLGVIRWAVCSNGATVYDLEHARGVQRRPIETGVLASAVAAIGDRFPTASFAWEMEEGMFHTDQWVKNRRAVGEVTWDAPGSTRVAHPHPADVDVLKLLVGHDQLVTYEWLEALRPHVPSPLSASTSGATFVEITSPAAR